MSRSLAACGAGVRDVRNAEIANRPVPSSLPSPLQLRRTARRRVAQEAYVCAAAGHECRRPVVVGDKWGCCFAERCDGEISPLVPTYPLLPVRLRRQARFRTVRFSSCAARAFSISRCPPGAERRIQIQELQALRRRRGSLDAVRCSPPPQGG